MSEWRRAGRRSSWQAGARGACAAAALLLGPGSVEAVPPASGCAVSTTPLAFGLYNPLSTLPHTLDTSAVIDCASNVKWVSVSLSSSASSVPDFRQMRSGANRLNYRIYVDPQRTQVWSEGMTRTFDMAKRGNLTVMLHGEVPARQNPVPGDYADTLTLTVVTP